MVFYRFSAMQRCAGGSIEGGEVDLPIAKHWGCVWVCAWRKSEVRLNVISTASVWLSRSGGVTGFGGEAVYEAANSKGSHVEDAVRGTTL